MITRRNFLKKSIITTTATSFCLSNISLLLANNNERIKTPLLKQADGTFKSISWEDAFKIIKIKTDDAIKQSGVNGVGLYTSANISMEESYALSKLYKAGFRSNNILTTSHKNDDKLFEARKYVYGIDGTSNTLDDILKTNVLMLFDVDLNKNTLIKTNIIKNKNIKYININTNNYEDKNAFMNLNIKKSTYHILLNFIMRDFLVNNKSKIDLKYLQQYTVFANYKDKKQWEISFKSYIKSFEKYDMIYLLKHIKPNNNESNNKFKNKIYKLSHMVISNFYKILSISGNEFNNSNELFKTNLLLQSLHIFINKHSRPGCGVINMPSNKYYNGSVEYVGLNNDTLATNMYIKYKEHRGIAQNIWNIPSNTLNPVSSDLIKNIDNKITKFLWITGVDEKKSYLNIQNKIFDLPIRDDIFIVCSDIYMNDTAKNSDLILPTAINDERTATFTDVQRITKFHQQTKVPYGMSMSLLWQTLEFSKLFTIKNMYKRVKVDNTQALKNVIKGFKLKGYKDNDTLFNILFLNPNTKLFQKFDYLNSEVNGDKRNIIGSDGGIFKGYRYVIQEYLFEELRQFGLKKAHDLAHYKQYQNSKNGIIWPYFNNKSIIYRFNPIDDIYALKSSKYDMKYSFYGKMKSKNLAFGNLEKINDKKKRSLKYRAKIFTTVF